VSTSPQVEAHFAVRTAGADWTPARALADPASPLLADHLATWRTTRLASDAVAASLMLLEHTRMLTWPVLACALRHGTWLDASLDDVRLDDGAPGSRLGFVRGPEAGPSDVVDRVLPAVLDTHLDPLVAALRKRTRAGRRTLWSNVAAGIAGGYLALSWTRPDRAHYVDAAAQRYPRTAGCAASSTSRWASKAASAGCVSRGAAAASRSAAGRHARTSAAPARWSTRPLDSSASRTRPRTTAS
jgi:hypothetical protein